MKANEEQLVSISRCCIPHEQVYMESVYIVGQGNPNTTDGRMQIFARYSCISGSWVALPPFILSVESQIYSCAAALVKCCERSTNKHNKHV